MTMAMSGFSEGGEFPLAIGTVKGYRDWYLTLVQESGTWEFNSLTGAFNGQWTSADWQEAMCGEPELSREHPEDAPVPVSDCGCGFWAYWKRPGTAPSFVSSSDWVFGSAWISPRPWIRVTLAGVAEGAGRTIIGSKGFRCQRMRVLAIAPALLSFEWLRLQQELGGDHTAVRYGLMAMISKALPGASVLPDPRELPELGERVML